MTLVEMFPGMVNSIETVITNALSDTEISIYVHDDTRIPEAPNLLVIGGQLASAETVKIIEKNGNKITVQRGYQSIARSWPPNTIIARNFTEADYAAIVENIRRLNTGKSTIILSKNEPIDIDDETYWLQDIGDSPDFGNIDGDGLVFANISDLPIEDDGYYFEEVDDNNNVIII